MSTAHLTYSALSAAISVGAGVSAQAARLADAPTFDQLGLDSLGLLGTVAQLEKELGVTLGSEFEQCTSPAELLEKVNAMLDAEGTR